MKSTFDRQNQEIALTYLRAARYCSRQKHAITYYMIAVSLLTTAISIAIKYLKLDGFYSTLILLFSGVVLISNIFCSYLKHLYNLDNVNLMERYDIFVYDMNPNKSLLKPLAEQTIVNYASKIKNKKAIENLRNYYYKTREEVEVKDLYINTVKNSLAHSHRLLIYVRVFFMLSWLSYFIILIAFAFVVDNPFTDTVINIFIPSLSAISLIVSAWIAYSEQIKRLTNANNVIKDMISSAGKKEVSQPSLSSAVNIRSVQDAIFMLRLNNFTVPELLINRFDKMLARDAQLIKEDISELPSVKAKAAKKAAAKNIFKKNAGGNEGDADGKKTSSIAQIPQPVQLKPNTLLPRDETPLLKSSTLSTPQNGVAETKKPTKKAPAPPKTAKSLSTRTAATTKPVPSAPKKTVNKAESKTESKADVKQTSTKSIAKN